MSFETDIEDLDIDTLIKDPCAWLQTRTRRLEVLRRRGSEDHFTLTSSSSFPNPTGPDGPELHTTFVKGKKKKHFTIDTGLGAVTQFRWLEKADDVERLSALGGSRSLPDFDFDRFHQQDDDDRDSVPVPDIDSIIDSMVRYNKRERLFNPSTLDLDSHGESLSPMDSAAAFIKERYDRSIREETSKRPGSGAYDFSVFSAKWLGANEDSEGPFSPHALSANASRPTPCLLPGFEDQDSPLASYWRGRSYGSEAAGICGGGTDPRFDDNLGVG